MSKNTQTTGAADSPAGAAKPSATAPEATAGASGKPATAKTAAAPAASAAGTAEGSATAGTAGTGAAGTSVAGTDAARRPRLAVRYLVVIVIGLLVGLGAGLIVNATRSDTYVATSTFALIPGATLPTTQGTNAELPPTDPGQLTLLTPVVAALTSDVSTSDVVAQRVGADVEYTAVEQLIPNSPLLFSVRVTADTPEIAVNVARTYQDVMTTSDKVSQSLAGSGAALRVVTSAIPPTKSSTPSSLLVIAATGATGAFIAAGGYWLVRNRRKLDVNRG